MNVNIKQKKKLKHRQKEYKKSLKFNKVKKRGHSKKRKAFQLSVLLNTLPIIFGNYIPVYTTNNILYL